MIDWAKVDWTKAVKYPKDGKAIDYLHIDSKLMKIFDQRKMDVPVLFVDALLRMRGPITLSQTYVGKNIYYEKVFIRADIFKPEVNSWDVLKTYPELLNEGVDDICLTNKCGFWFFDVSLADVSTTDEEVERIAAEDSGEPIVLPKLIADDVDDEGNGWYHVENGPRLRLVEKGCKDGFCNKNER